MAKKEEMGGQEGEEGEEGEGGEGGRHYGVVSCRRPSIGGNELEEWNQVSPHHHSSSSSNHHRTQNFHHQH